MRIKSERVPFFIGVIIVVLCIIGNIVVAAMYNAGVFDSGTSTGQGSDEVEHTEIETKKETIAFETKTVDDDSIEFGKTEVKTEGANGVRTYTYSVTYKGEKEISRKVTKEEITKKPITKIVANGTKVVWHCKDVTSYDRNSSNDNLCTSSTGEQRYVGDCEAVALDPNYHPGQSGGSRYNGCAR